MIIKRFKILRIKNLKELTDKSPEGTIEFRLGWSKAEPQLLESIIINVAPKERQRTLESVTPCGVTYYCMYLYGGCTPV